MINIPLLEEQEGRFRKSDFEIHHRTTICGTTGTGKSVLFDTLLDYYSKKTLVLLLDTKREYSHIPDFDVDEHLGLKMGLFKIYGLQSEDGIIRDLWLVKEYLAKLLFIRNTPEIKDKHGNLKPNPYRESGVMLAIEELANAHKKDSRRLYDSDPEFAVYLQQGRARNCGFLGTTQRIQEVHTTILSESQNLIFFNMHSERDIKAVGHYIDQSYFNRLKLHDFMHINIPKKYIRHCYALHSGELPKGKSFEYYRKIFGRE